ncbi:glycoside hydrolase family 43 protein [Enterococcus sp. LJL90]
MTETFLNPIVYERADPWVYKHTDGYYYFTGSVPGYQEIEVRRGKTLNDLRNGETKIVWHAHKKGLLSNLIWAPEIHFIRGKWYIFFAAADDAKQRNRHHHHRMFVIENSNPDPFSGEWVEKGQIKTQFESFSLDGTAFEHQGRLYYVWAQLDPSIPGNSNLYISEMENPWTLKGRQTLLTIPSHGWEKIGFKVNEGPAVITKGEHIFIAYSASATDENYAMGILWADINSDLLDGYSWQKSSEPVFTSSEKNNLYGPGHNSFTKSFDNQEDVIVYHARPEKNHAGDPLFNPNRHAYAQIFTWDENNFPIFGIPGETLASLTPR